MPDDYLGGGIDVLGAAFSAFPDAVCILEPIGASQSSGRDWRYIASNDAMERLFTVGNLAGHTVGERFPEVAGMWCAEFDRVLASGKAETLIREGAVDARTYEVTLTPLSSQDRSAIMANIRDVTTALSDREGRLIADARYKTLFNAIDEGFCIVEVLFDDAGQGTDYRFLEANHAVAEHTGLSDLVGKRMRDMQPDIEAHWAVAYGRIARSGVAERFEAESSAMGRWFDVFAFPVGETAPYLVGILFSDVGPRKEMELALRHSEGRLHSLIDATSDLIFHMNPDCTEIEPIGGKGQVSLSGTVTNWVEKFIPQSDRGDVRKALEVAIASRTPMELEHRVRKSGDDAGWMYSRAVPVLDDRGDVTEWFGMATDITARKQAEDELARGAQMLRVASEIGKVGFWDWNVNTGELAWSDEHFRMEGYVAGEVTPSYQIWAERVHPDDLANAETKIAHAQQTGEDYVNEYRVRHPNGDIHWMSARGRFLYDQDHKPVRMLGAMIDTTQRRRQEEWHKLLVAELQHRVRNLIAMVRSVARLSAPSHRNVDNYVDHLIGRLQAMGRTQSTLTRSPGSCVDLGELVREELVVHAPRPNMCFVEGPDVALAPHAAEILTLAIHELATNSIKYGALGDTGYIRITWTTSDRDHKTWVSLRWHETAPHRKIKNARKGFGRRLIEERVPYELHGTGSMKVHDTGVLAQLEFPLVEGPSIFETTTKIAEEL